MTERIHQTISDMPSIVHDIEELQNAWPNDWTRIVVSIYDERTLAAVQTYKTLMKLREERTLIVK